MAEMNWAEFDKLIDAEGLDKDLQDSYESGGQKYVDVPFGEYEVKVNSIELKLTKSTGKPMVTIWFKVLKGNYEDQSIFYNQVITQGFQIHLNQEFLRSLDSGVEIPHRFTSYEDYADLLAEVEAAIERQRLEYALLYGENKKGYKTYAINDVFEG